MDAPRIPWENRIGDRAEDIIKSRLACFSIPTKYTRDVGIDFYCELLENDMPTIPFYVQAKGTGQFDTNEGVSIKKSTMIYWLSQYHPVFLIMHDESKGDCYWKSIEDIRYELLKRLSTPVDTVYIKMERSNMLHDGKDANAEFIRKIKENVYSIELWKGRPQFEGEGYVLTTPRPPRSDFELVNIKENIRMSMYSLVQHYLLNGELPKVLMFCNFLVEFDLSHYNHFVWLGQVKAILGDVEGSKRAYQGALDICERDKNWPKPSMDQIKSMIKGEMEKL